MTGSAADLLRLDAAIDRIEQAGELRESGVSFGVGDGFSQDWEGMSATLDDLMRRLAGTVAHYASVETSAGMTVVGYKGDMRSVFATELTSGQFEAHMASLAAALDYRARLTRLLTATFRTLMAIVTAVAFPASAAAALRSAWRLVEELRAVVPPLG